MTLGQPYNMMFKEYPDVLNVNDMSQVLGVSVKTVYKLLKEQSIGYLRIGREYRIPKINLIKYLLKKDKIAGCRIPDERDTKISKSIS